MGVLLERIADDDPVYDLARDIIDKHHFALKKIEGGLLLNIVMARLDPPSDKPVLVEDGERVNCIVSVISYERRVGKQDDAQIKIVRDYWVRLSNDEQRAFLDEAITYIDVKVGEDGCVEIDDLGRPKLKRRPPDWHLQGFLSIAQRYQGTAPCAAAARAFEKKYGHDVLAHESLYQG